MTSKERLLAAMSRHPVDYVPCCPLMNFQPEDQRWGKRWQYPFGPSDRERLDYMTSEMGADQILEAGIGFYPDSRVNFQTWMDGDIIHKTWNTPSGELHASVRFDEHWLPGLDIPFFNDYNPSHFTKPWIDSMQDVDCLRHILLPPSRSEDLEKIRFYFKQRKKLADRYRVPLVLRSGMGLTGAVNMFGPTQLSMLSITGPELVDAYLEVEHQYNLRVMELGIELEVDIIRRNGFYETCDLFSPAILESFLSNRLKQEAGAAHSAGKLFGYTILSGYIPMLDYLSSVGIDSLMCPDIFLKDGNGEKLRDDLGGETSFWTGPSDTVHMPYENSERVREAVRNVVQIFGKTGLIITPCSSSKAVFPWENMVAMIDEWKKLR